MKTKEKAMIKTRDDREIEENEPLRFLQSFRSGPICDVDVCTERAINFFQRENGKAIALCGGCEYLFTNIDWDHSPYPDQQRDGWKYMNRTSSSPGSKLKRVLDKLDGVSLYPEPEFDLWNL